MTEARIHGVTVILDFGMGHPERSGKTYGRHTQADVIDAYGRRLFEELEYDNVRMHPIDTRRAPPRNEAERLKEVPANFLPLVLSCDWHDSQRIHNASSVEFCGPYYHIAQAIAFSLSEWGRCYVWGHRVSRPIAVSGEQHFVRVKPFALNGPHADEYLQRLDALGLSIGHAVGGYLLEKKMGRLR